MSSLGGMKPWVVRPFELITHGEIHFRRGSDYDKRLALVSFDNAVEVSITTYLTIKPIHRGGRTYTREAVSRWLHNYHTKLDFFLEENGERKLPEYQSKDVIVWLHDQRNEQYHGHGSGVPEQSTLEGIRQTALWVFSVLFEVIGIEETLEKNLTDKSIDKTEIPDSFVVPAVLTPSQLKLSPEQAKALAGASLIGKWSEGNKADIGVVRRIVGEI